MKLLLVIDLLNGFCRKNYPLSLPKSTKSIEEYIETRVRSFLNKNDKVLFICDSHNLSDPEINNPFPAHCLKGSVEAEIVDTIKKYANIENTVYKNTLSITHETDLVQKIKEINPTEIEVSGVCTDICILFAVYELRVRGYNVKVNSKGVMALKTENQQFFLNYMKDQLAANVTF